MLPARNGNKYAIQAVENALDVLEALSDSPEEFRISQLTERLMLSKMTIFRLLATFERRGYVEKEKAGRYRIGTSALEMGQKMLLRLSLLQKAKPVMESLAWKCNEAVYLGIRKGDDVLLLDLVDSLEQVKVVSLVGTRYPVEKVAPGTVLVADRRQPDDQERPGDPSGFAADCGALGTGIISLAVPLRNGSGRLCGSLSFVGPEFRFGEDRIERELRPSLIEAGEVISSRLGYFGPSVSREGSRRAPSRHPAPTPARRDRSAIIL